MISFGHFDNSFVMSINRFEWLFWQAFAYEPMSGQKLEIKLFKTKFDYNIMILYKQSDYFIIVENWVKWGSLNLLKNTESGYDFFEQYFGSNKIMIIKKVI